jgi:hypothetical protein
LALRLRNSNTIIEEALSSNTNKMVWDGIVAYATEFGIDTFKGFRVNKGFFSDWACQHLGLSEAVVKDSLVSLLGKGFFTQERPGRRRGHRQQTRHHQKHEIPLIGRTHAKKSYKPCKSAGTSSRRRLGSALTSS